MVTFNPGDTAVSSNPTPSWKGAIVTILRTPDNDSPYSTYDVQRNSDGVKGLLMGCEMRKVTIVESAPQTIDHGRLDTIKRRKAFSTVHIEISDSGNNLVFVIPTDAMLSPRRIARILDDSSKVFWGGKKGRRNRGRKAARFADAACDLLRSFRDNGYADITLEARVKAWRVRLVKNAA